MREIESSQITQAVTWLCQEANFKLCGDVLHAIKQARWNEESPLGKEVLKQIIKNASIARKECLPLCQDCGTAVVFLEIGQDVHITGGDLYTSIEEGVRQGYTISYLRKSVVNRPFSARTNTGDNTPPIIHTDIVPGNLLKITLMPKGGGSENMSCLAMLMPGEGREGIINLVVKTVDDAGGKPCPPLIIGIGIGATSEKVMLLAKKALLHPIAKSNPDPEIADLEHEILDRINALGVGPMGFGGRVTALSVHIEVMPTHIASLPVAVNLQCHSARHQEIIL
ncbi:fumarate hydratase [Chloroflexota bacterium]